MKPYSGRLKPTRRGVQSSTPSVAQSESLPDQILKISARAAAAWSLSGFLFGVGYISRIDPSVLQIITIADVFSLSLSYAVLIVPILSVMVLWPWIFMIPVPRGENGSVTRLDLLPIHIFSRALPYRLLILAITFAILPNFIWIIANGRHWIDRSSLLYMFGDIYLLPFTFTLPLMLFPIPVGNRTINKRFIGLLFSLSVLISGSYLAGDYAASLRMNNPSKLDCAILSGDGGRCTPILIWGSSYFITWHGKRMRALPTSKVDHIWLHPNKEPDKRRNP